MKSEYKRDINGNYIVLYENEEPDTSSYQMRMFFGNSIPVSYTHLTLPTT